MAEHTPLAASWRLPRPGLGRDWRPSMSGPEWEHRKAQRDYAHSRLLTVGTKVHTEALAHVRWVALLTLAVDFVSVFVLAATWPDRGHSVFYFPRPGHGCHNVWCWLALLVVLDLIHLSLIALESWSRGELVELQSLQAAHAAAFTPDEREKLRAQVGDMAYWTKAVHTSANVGLTFRILVSVLGLCLLWLPNPFFDVPSDGQCHPALYHLARCVATAYSLFLFAFVLFACAAAATEQSLKGAKADLSSAASHFTDVEEAFHSGVEQAVESALLHPGSSGARTAERGARAHRPRVE